MISLQCSRVFTPAEELGETILLIDHGKIQAMGAHGDIPCPAGAEVIDARGLIAAPGYLDWQINGAFGCDFSSEPETVWEAASRLPAYGVTAFLPTIISTPDEIYRRAIAVLQAGPPEEFRGAKPLGWHFEGPFLNPAKKGAHDLACLRLPGEMDVSAWTRQDGVWLVTLAPELEGGLDLVRQLRMQGVAVSAGHSLASLEQGREAIAAGLDAGTHLFNGMPPMDHHAPGLAAALLESPQVTVGIIPDGMHVDPAMVRLAWRLKGRQGLTIVTDACAALGLEDGDALLGGRPVQVREGRVTLTDGTMAGSMLGMDQSVRNLAAFTGCSLREAIYSAAAAPAGMLGADGKGWLRPGADADLVLLTPDGHAAGTIIGGKVWRQVPSSQAGN